MTAYEEVKKELSDYPRRWAVSGAAGFIGSHLVEHLLRLGQQVVGLDNFATGHQRNLDDVSAAVGEDAWQRFTFVEGDIRQQEDCLHACEGADYLLHQAALGSVPRSIADPATSTAVNIDGFVNMLVAARDAGIKRVAYASSSSVYGDHPGLPKVEDHTGTPLSPYAVTKCTNELFASVFGRTYEMEIIGLRYFNVFGPRQDPNGAYAAAIPRWIETLKQGNECTIFGDGLTSRDFSYIDNIVQANILAVTTENTQAVGEVFNVGAGGRVSLTDLYGMIYEALLARTDDKTNLQSKAKPLYSDFRKGDVKHSNADITKARDLLGYEVLCDAADGLAKTVDWYLTR